VPNKNLLDDDEDAGTGAPSSAIHDHSAEIGNLQNQLQSTNRSLENTKTERNNLEGTVESQKIQLSTLQTQLSSAKAAYETETRLLSTLRDRFTSQSSDIQKAREELIRSESDLSAIRVDKAEVEQNFLRDKEEIRELQRKMTETGSMIEVTKVEIEKAKKDAKQQKGLLAIAKKQLAARESERAKVEQELQESLVEAAETREELDASEAELARDPPTATTTNGFTLAPSPTLSGDSTSFASAKPLPGSPGSPSSINGPASAKSNNPFERLTAGSGSASRSQSPFLPLASSSTPAPNEGTTTDNPFTFDQAFGSEEAGPVSDVDGTSIGTEGTVQPSVPKIVGELNIVTNDLSSPSSERDLFSTPPMTGLDTLASGARTSTVDPDAVNPSASGTTSAAPSTDRSGEAHTNINAPLKELDGNESDSSDENSEDETPLANLAKRPPPPPNKVDLKVNAPKEAPVTNGHALPQSKVESPFPPVPVPIPPADAKSANAFPPAPAHPSATSPFAVSSETRKSTNMNDFDKAFGNLAGDARATTENNLSSFDAVFEDQFDFSTSTSLPAADPSSSGSTTFPPAPANLSGTVKRSASGFENAFTPQQSAMTPTAPTSSIEGLPPLPQIPESKPFSFDDAFSSISHEPKPFSFEDAFSTPAPALSPPLAASLTSTALSSQPPPNAEAQSLSLEDASGSNMTRGDSGFATISSRSSIPPVTQSPISALASGSPVRNSTSPRDSLSFPTSQSRQDSPPPVRVTSPRRPTTSSSEKSVDKNKDQGRHSKISVCWVQHLIGKGS
jgi:epidermal growth factor receptor substrate 15